MKRQSGFNIIELMVTVAVLGVLLGVGVPGIQSYIYNSRLTTQINSFSSSLAHARSEAIKLNAHVVVCLSSDGVDCDGYNGGQTWNKGWIIFVDRNGGDNEIDRGTAGVDDCAADSTTDCVLTVFPAFPGTNVMTPAASVKDIIGYRGDGSVFCNTDADSDPPEACPKATSFFTLCDFRGAEFAKGVAVSSTGRVSSISKQPNGSALHMSVMRRAQGFTLVEILIAVVIFSIGLLGIAGLQVAGMRFTHGSQLRTTAVSQVESMADLMRANPFGVDRGLYNVKDSDIPDTTTPDCAELECTATERAAYDLKTWNYPHEDSIVQSNADALPQGDGMVCRDSTPNDGESGAWECDNTGDVYAIKVQWEERTVGADDVGKAGNTNADTLTQRFVMTVVPAIDNTP